ncbi:MAG TPA: hypothetical protein VLK32_03435 [Bacillota bacterium]|nr:hypothetical protein [Bacillota bacterium]
MRAVDRVLDAIDLETVLLAEDERSARRLAFQLAKELGLTDADIVALEWRANMARVRVRGYIHRPGHHYTWLGQTAR